MRAASQPTWAKRAPRFCPLIDGCPSLTHNIDTLNPTPIPTRDASGTISASARDTTAVSDVFTSPLASLLEPSTTASPTPIPVTAPADTSEATPSSDADTPAVPTTLFPSHEIPSRSAKSSPPFNPTSNGSASAAASVFQGELTAPASLKPTYTPIPGSTGNASPSSSSRSPPPSLGPTTAVSSSSHRVSRVPTAALAGAIVAAVLLATAAAGALLWVWLRRRRARALLSETQNGTSGSSTGTSDRSASAAAIPTAHSRVSKIRAEDDVPGTRTRTCSLVSGSSYDACAGSTTGTETPPAVQTAMDHKGSAPQAPAPPPCPPPAHAEDRGPLGNPGGAAPQSVSASASAQEAGVHAGERLLHFALPWAVGQRVLAMMAGEDGDGDARSVGIEGSEPLPAYEPRPA